MSVKVPSSTKNVSSSRWWTCNGGMSPCRPSASMSDERPPVSSRPQWIRTRLSMNHLGSGRISNLRFGVNVGGADAKLRTGVLSSDRLTPFSYCVLALVGEGGAGPHDLTRMMRQGRIYWTAAESQWYAEPKRLEVLGYLRSEKRPGQTRERTHYTLTARGRKALRAWIAQPSALPRVQHEAIVRVLAGDL